MRRWQSTTPTEAQFKSAIVQYAEANGWKVISAPDGKHMQRIPVSMRGWPDLHLMKVRTVNGVIYMEQKYRELKVGKNARTDEQVSWGNWLTEAGCDYGVWRDSTPWCEIEGELR